MGNTRTKRSHYILKGLSGLIFAANLMIAPQLLRAEQATVTAVTETPITFLSKGTTHYRLADPDRPRIGTLITPASTKPDAENFRFCDGTTAKVVIETLIKSKDSCDRSPEGPFNLADFASGRAIPVYNTDRKVIGALYDVTATDLGYEGTISVPTEITEQDQFTHPPTFPLTDAVAPQMITDFGIATGTDGQISIILEEQNS